jgi:DNA-binding NarL/FixJ family response regulator
MSSPLRVVVAEDNFVVREGLRRLLDDGDDVDVVDAVPTAIELLRLVDLGGLDVVVTDVRMPPAHGTEGIVAAHRIRASSPEIGVVVLSQHADASYAQALFAGGTSGLAYLLKERVGHREELVRAIRAVHGGGSVIDPQIVDALLSARRRIESSPLHRLSPRELDVLRSMAAGLTNRAIADRLYVSESAVSKHVGSIFHKLDLAEDPGIDRRVSAALAYVASDHRAGMRDGAPDPGEDGAD